MKVYEVIGCGLCESLETALELTKKKHAWNHSTTLYEDIMEEFKTLKNLKDNLNKCPIIKVHEIITMDSISEPAKTGTITVVLYGKKKTFKSVREARRFFMTGMSCCDPDSSEYERYAFAYDSMDEVDNKELKSGKNYLFNTDNI